ncbi:DASH complex subunit ask1 domain-containing protein [Sarocladium implicatum]|nr:DASH complex subunit ask1 domain-containing protein [Sarocladium implicatum]
MARPSAAARNLSLTEELERLEQSITLTLQEIDHNFSKSHRIVTTSILPLVEQYGEHSRAVWDASKFWKQFFEASANVSLSGYEEHANDGETTAADESTAMRDESTADYSAREEEEEDGAAATPAATPGARQATYHEGEESMLDEGEITGSTPRVPSTKIVKSQFANLESPYEVMKREMKNEEGDSTAMDDEDESTVLFAQRTARLPDMSMTPGNAEASAARDQSTHHKDPLLHRVLDKNYRIQATPLKPPSRLSPIKTGGGSHHKVADAWQDSPMSSPEIAMPKLRSEAFMSPFKSNARERLAAATQQGPRTPGVSVQTPGTGRKTRDVFQSTAKEKGKVRDEIDWDDDDDDLDFHAGMSPPKTIQFALPPSKLMQTPAKQASKQIVDSILIDAGENPESSEFSPSLVKINENLLDDSF